MEVPRYLQVLWASKWLLLVGVVVAAAAAFLAGFKFVDGEVVPRADQQYTASTTILVSSQTQPLYQAVLPGQELVEGETPPEDVDLTSKAILYAYLISGTDMRDQVEAIVGELDDTEGLTALRRTTQPGGDEAFPGRYVLPILDVVGGSDDPERAEEISRTAATLFQEQALADQEAVEMPESERVTFEMLDQSDAVADEGSNPAIPIVVAFLGVFLLFVAAAFIVAGAKSSRARKRAAREAAAAAGAAGEPGDGPAAADVDRRSRRRREDTAAPTDPADHEFEPAPESADESERVPTP
ncbi:hypothetical protein GCM10022200_15600 [Microbacterium awajiense]|uniref:Capsular polysaccharide biosynthesis protein n=1 Tax=Microbacterium awajiense TaxID=415214 RepID=A0ABP7AIL1_9MICO